MNRQPSKNQIKRLYTLAGKAGMTHDEVIAEIQKAYKVESTLDLSLRQYEDMCINLLARAGLRRQGDGLSPAERTEQYPTVYKYAQIEPLLDEVWPACPTHPIAINDAQMPFKQAFLMMLDDCRLARRSGRISRQTMRVSIERLGKTPIPALEATVQDWLTKNRTLSSGNPERYIGGIARNKIRDLQKGKLAIGKKTQLNEVQQRIQAIIKNIVAIAGEHAPGDLKYGCICHRGILDYEVDKRQRSVPCPWCQPGQTQLRGWVETMLKRQVDPADETLWRAIRTYFERKSAPASSNPPARHPVLHSFSDGESHSEGGSDQSNPPARHSLGEGGSDQTEAQP